MTRALVQIARRGLRRLGLDIVRYNVPSPAYALDDVLTVLSSFRDLAIQAVTEEEGEFLRFCAKNYSISKSQLFQDLFVQYILGERKGGFFVEFGAANGLYLSNSFSLESVFGWNGILAEPATCWHEDIKKNRNCRIDFRCVWDRDGEQLQFNQVADAELSTVASFSASDLHAKTRETGRLYTVNTVSLDSLLVEHSAPETIDYLSVDTEGSELKILSAFDFGRHKVRVISVEHNFTPDRESIYLLLTSKGFIRKFEKFSRWDDWYVSYDVLK